MSLYQVALLIHLLGAFSFVSGALLAAVAFETARRCQHSDEIALLLGLTRGGALLVLAGGAVLLVAGLWLAAQLDQTSAGWVVAALALFVASLALGALGGRRPKAARRHATDLARDGREPDERLHTLLDDRVSRYANYGSSALVVAIIVLMVWQPGR